MENNAFMNRREFFRNTFLVTLSIPLLRTVAFAAVDFVKEDDPMAKALNYCQSADKGKGKVCPNRKDPTKKDQYCKGCQFYTADGADKGKCQLLQSKYVKPTGWCNSWVK